MEQLTAMSGIPGYSWRNARLGWMAVGVLAASLHSPALGQTQPSAEDAAVDTICQLGSVSDGDKRRIRDWVQLQVDRLAKVPEAEQLGEANKLRGRFAARLSDTKCTDAFRKEFVAQTAAVASDVLPKPETAMYVAFALSRVLVEMNRLETLPGLIDCLKSSAPVARYMCARGIASLHSALASARTDFGPARSALREAGLTEQDPVALKQIYRALAYPGAPAASFDAYMAIFQRRIDEATQKGAFVADGAEIEAFNFLDASGVLNGLNNAQKQDLVTKAAGFLRLFANRYDTEKLSFEETDRLERQLFLVESVLDRVVDKDGGNIRSVLQDKGHAGRAEVLAEANKWIGGSDANAPGALNGAPWNVPLGGIAQAP